MTGLGNMPKGHDWVRRRFVPAEAEVQSVRRFMHLEAFVLFLIPIFAAAMVRPYAF